MYVFIVNPIAGKGKAKKIHSRLMKTEQYKKLHALHFYTEYKGHAEKILNNLIQQYGEKNIKVIIVIGGDGTVHEVINGLGTTFIQISFIPGGSGNDFARGTFIAKDPNETLKRICETSRTTPYWIGSYTADEKHRNFVNCLGFGLDAVVSKLANESWTKKAFNIIRFGTIVYVLALIRALLSYKPIHINVKMDGRKYTFKKCLLMTVNNHPYFGGGMKINPIATNNEKHLSVLVVDSISKWKVLALFATVFTGRHLQFKEVNTFKATTIHIYADESIPFQVDGEEDETLCCRIKKEPTPIYVRGSSNA